MSAVNEISKKKLHTGEIGNFHPVSSAPMLVLAHAVPPGIQDTVSSQLLVVRGWIGTLCRGCHLHILLSS